MATALELFQRLALDFEGRFHTPYRDPAKGVLTVGIGHVGTNVKVGQVWVDSQIDQAFVKDSADAMLQAFLASPTLRHASPGTQAAVFDFVFNLGIGRYDSSTFKKDIDRGDLAAAKKSILLWDKGCVNGVEVSMPGLAKRRKAASDLIGT